MRKFFPVILGIFVFGFYEWLTFRCLGYDWSVPVILGDVLTSSIDTGNAFPYFSYFYNGGVYLAHDPQAFVTSPLFNLFVRLFGGAAGARWLSVAYGVVGFYCTYFFLKTRFSELLSGFGALALSLSLGMFWRIVAGHMHFLPEMFLPFFLLSIVRIETSSSMRQRVAWIIGMALGGAWMIYEPGFHALFYFIIPGLLIEITLRVLIQPRATLKLFIPLAAATLLAILMILPKILAWKSLSMTRTPDATDGTLALKDVLSALFITARATVMGFHVPGSNPERWHFIFEVNTALMPVASLAALIGIVLGIRHQWYREKNFCLAAGCLVFSVLVASNQPFWEFIQNLTTGGIRVPSRFLGLGAFGLMLFSVYGLEGISSRFKKQGRAIIIVATFLLLFFSWNWLYRAQKSETLLASSLPLSVARVDVPRFLMNKYCPVASGCLNSYQAGYYDDPYIQYLTANHITEENFSDSIPKNVQVLPTLIVLSLMRPGEVIDLPLRSASFGHRVTTIPTGLSPTVETVEGHLRIQGDPLHVIEKLEISPLFPAPKWSLWIAGLTALFSIILLGILALFSASNHAETITHPLGNASGRHG